MVTGKLGMSNSLTIYNNNVTVLSTVSSCYNMQLLLQALGSFAMDLSEFIYFHNDIFVAFKELLSNALCYYIN